MLVVANFPLIFQCYDQETKWICLAKTSWISRSIFKTSHLVSLIPLAKFSKLVLQCLFSLAVKFYFGDYLVTAFIV